MKAFALSLMLFVPPLAHAQELVQDTVVFYKAQVVSVVSEEERLIPGTETPTLYQALRVELLEGPRTNEIIDMENDYTPLAEGEVFYVRHTIDAISGMESYTVSDPYRLPVLGWLTGLFLLCLLVFGGKQGMRGLIALALSFLCIVYLLLPGILAGHSPVAVALAVSAVIIVVGSYITHGLSRTTSSAVVGMLATVALSGLLAHLSIRAAKLSGYLTDETVALNFSTAGNLDFAGLLLGGLLIGLLGVLYDAAIGQAVAIEELATVGKDISRRELFARGVRIGREHIGALVNTLAIAYVGVSLPLLLLLTQVSNQSLVLMLNQELFATELVRILVGSIGLILAVPITTAVAVYMLHGRSGAPTGGHAHHH